MLIDCLFIGHNEMEFTQYEKSVKQMGVHSGAYRDLELNFIQYNHKPYSAPGIFNLFYCGGNNESRSPMHVGETFNLAIAYLGTYLNKRGFAFEYVNSFQYEKERLKNLLTKEKILTVAIPTTLYVSVFPINEIVSFIKKYNREAKIIIGGPFVSTQVRNHDPMVLQYSLESIAADFYVNSSQGEATLTKIIRSLKNNQSIKEIENIYYKTDSGYVSTPLLKENNQLSQNMVNWDLFTQGVDRYVNVRTSISCPFTCSFCGFPEHAGKYQTASVPDIEAELNRLARIKSLKSVHFIDDTFNVPKERFKEILRMMIKNRYPFRWHSHFRCQFADEETVELMKESGCEGVFLGIESGSDQILKNMNKSASSDKYRRGIELLEKHHILTYGSFIIGFPGETDDTVHDTVSFIKNSGIDFFRTQLWYCDTITPIWKEREKYNITGSNFEWSHATMDSKRAADIIDEIFLSIDSPTWVPQYNFEFDGIFHLLHRDFTTDQVKNFLGSFNRGIREKLQNPSQREISFNVIKEIGAICSQEHALEEVAIGKTTSARQDDAGFDF